MVRIVRQQEVRRTMSCRHGRPVRLTHNQVVNTTQHKAASAMADHHRLILEDPEPNGIETLSNLFRIAPEVVVIPMQHQAPRGAPASGAKESTNESSSLAWPVTS